MRKGTTLNQDKIESHKVSNRNIILLHDSRIEELYT